MRFSRKSSDEPGGGFGGGLGAGPASEKRALVGWVVAAVVIGVLVVCLILGWYWSREPDLVRLVPEPSAETSLIEGSTTSRTVHQLMSTLLNKPGGFLSNDILPPGVWLDNMPNWEFGVLVQIRDMTRAMRRDMARSQSQSSEDPSLAVAEPRFNFDNTSWALPASESEYRGGMEALADYIRRLERGDAEFYARADNLASWIGDVSTRLGSFSQRLSASVGRAEVTEQGRAYKRTPWLEIDDVFYEARGSAWALVHLLRAVEHDYADVLERKNALVSLQQIIRDLEATQRPMHSPMVFNGSGFGVLANHSLVMANYLSRANAALIDLRKLLEQG
ncbi:MAG TPA: DUF2333 family protein [Pseudomonas xinjiangensis]|uniref:DUF2333 family protein n=2 Tax=root TaxID=1 RepID=A0A7V1BPD0_9GAMM|nr:DUF2333 family protein [Halopseudomonas xinjiangensis]HEC49433.1 DUF2333 family protein [Halopseudomonas xinjiangensis]